jgi:hypothetical protein
MVSYILEVENRREVLTYSNRPSQSQEFSGDFIEWPNNIDTAVGDRFFRHPIYNTRGFILRDSLPACVLNSPHTTRAVVAHSRKNSGDHIASELVCARLEKYVDSWSVSVYLFCSENPRLKLRASAFDRQMKITRSDEALPRPGKIPINRFFDGYLTQFIHALRKAGGESRRHMLNYHDRRAVWRHSHKYILDGFRSTG